MSVSSCISQQDVEQHDFQVVRNEWQKRDVVNGAILQFHLEILVCRKCGCVVDPWVEKNGVVGL
jgi:hypothetical protein